MKIGNIKFKAKRLDNGEWIEGKIAHFEDTIWIKPLHSKCAEVDPDTICMFTGLKDCKGNEVWEGDMLEGSNKGEICFEQGAFLIHSIDDNTLYSLSNYTTWDGKITCKVIGNKFDKGK